MELRQLRYLEAVARHGHFTRAAEELHVAQSAVSHQIRRLEQELGIELLERTTRSVELTAAGQVVVARAGAALAEADGIAGELDELRGLVRGTILIGALLPAGPLDLPALLAEFSRRYPGIEIEFREGTSAYMREQLAAGELDVAFVLEAEPQPPELGRLELSEAEMVLAMTPEHPLAARAPLPIERLDGENLIAFRRGSSVRLALDQALERVGAQAADRARGFRPALDPGTGRPGLRRLGAPALVRRVPGPAAVDPAAPARDPPAGGAPLAKAPHATAGRASVHGLHRRLGRPIGDDRGLTDEDPRIATVEVGDLTLQYRELGSGPPVLLLHGWPTSSFLWRNVMKPIAARNRAIALDLPGFGGSSKPPDASYSFRFFEEAIDGFLAELGVDRLSLAVHDLGGPIGVHWAISSKERVERLAVLNTLLYSRLSFAAIAFVVGARIPGVRNVLTSDRGLDLAMKVGMANRARLTDELRGAVREPFATRDARRALAKAGCGLSPKGLADIERALPGARVAGAGDLWRARPHPARRREDHGQAEARRPARRGDGAAGLRPLPPGGRPRAGRLPAGRVLQPGLIPSTSARNSRISVPAGPCGE